MTRSELKQYRVDNDCRVWNSLNQVTSMSIKVFDDSFRLTCSDNNIPQASNIERISKGVYILTWYISGIFTTFRRKSYYNDIREKLCCLMDAVAFKPKSIVQFPTFFKENVHKESIFELSEFKHMEDKRYYKGKIYHNNRTKFTESTFDLMRKEAYKSANMGTYTIERLDEACHLFSNDYKKEKWLVKYIDKFIRIKFKTGGTRYVSETTRTINANTQSKKRSNDKYRKFVNYVNFLGTCEINVANVAKVLNLARQTVRKYMKVFTINLSGKFIASIGACWTKPLLTEEVVMKKKNTNPFYGTQTWTKLSKAFRLSNPLCKMCEDRGVTRVVKYVDHVIPIEIDYELRLDVENLMSLCAKCHSHKTQQVDVQLLKGLEPKPLRGTTADGFPTDNAHHWNSHG